MAPHDASQGAISSGNRGFFPASTFDFSACVEKEVIVVGVGVYFFIPPCGVFFR